jgi:hypothetical protein
MHAVTQQAPETVGGLIDELFLLREQRRKLAETDKDLRDQYSDLEARLIAALDHQEATQARGRSATATLTEEDYASVTDWTTVYDYIRQTESWFLLHKRISNASWKELTELNGEPVPGTQAFRKRSIALRRI